MRYVHQPRQTETGIRLDAGDGTFVTCSVIERTLCHLDV